ITGQAAEGGVALLVVFKCRIRRGQQFPARPRLEAKLVEVLWLAHIQRAQQHRIHYSEDEDVRPNPKHQSEGGYERERGRLPKHAQRITNIQQQILHKLIELTQFKLVIAPASGELQRLVRCFGPSRKPLNNERPEAEMLN